MRKKIFIIVGCLILLLVGIGIAELVERIELNTLEPGEIYKSKNVRVIELLDPPQMQIIYSKPPYNEADYYSDISVVVAGTVKSLQEAEAQYPVDGYIESLKMTIFELAVDEYLYKATEAIENKGTIIVGVSYGSFSSASQFPVLKVGKRLLLCGRLTSSLGDPSHVEEFLDYYAVVPEYQLLEMTGEKYVLPEDFVNYLPQEDLIANALQVTQEQIAQYPYLQDADAMSAFGIHDPNGLLAIMKERYIRYSDDFNLKTQGDYLADSIWDKVQTYYSAGKSETEALIVEIVKRNA